MNVIHFSSILLYLTGRIFFQPMLLLIVIARSLAFRHVAFFLTTFYCLFLYLFLFIICVSVSPNVCSYLPPLPFLLFVFLLSDAILWNWPSTLRKIQFWCYFFWGASVVGLPIFLWFRLFFSFFFVGMGSPNCPLSFAVGPGNFMLVFCCPCFFFSYPFALTCIIAFNLKGNLQMAMFNHMRYVPCIIVWKMTAPWCLAICSLCC